MAGDLQAITFKADDLARGRVGEEDHLAHAEVEQDLGTDAVFDQPLLALATGLRPSAAQRLHRGATL